MCGERLSQPQVIHARSDCEICGRSLFKLPGRGGLAVGAGESVVIPAGAAYVFPTRTGRRQYESKVRTGTLGGAVKRADANLEKAGLTPVPARLTPHSLRRTFASALYALKEDPGVVMDEMGHTDPALALRVYRQAMRRGEDENARLRALVDGGQMAFGGIPAPEQATESEVSSAA
jgi:integrase